MLGGGVAVRQAVNLFPHYPPLPMTLFVTSDDSICGIKEYLLCVEYNVKSNVPESRYASMKYIRKEINLFFCLLRQTPSDFD